MIFHEFAAKAQISGIRICGRPPYWELTGTVPARDEQWLREEMLRPVGRPSSALYGRHSLPWPLALRELLLMLEEGFKRHPARRATARGMDRRGGIDAEKDGPLCPPHGLFFSADLRSRGEPKQPIGKPCYAEAGAQERPGSTLVLRSAGLIGLIDDPSAGNIEESKVELPSKREQPHHGIETSPSRRRNRQRVAVEADGHAVSGFAPLAFFDVEGKRYSGRVLGVYRGIVIRLGEKRGSPAGCG